MARLVRLADDDDGADGRSCDRGNHRVPAEWRALSEHALNDGQESTLAALNDGGNVLSRQPTGSGKSYMYLLPALARWAAVARARAACADVTTRDKLPLPPIVIVATPFRALCEDAERQALLFIEKLYADDLLPMVDVNGACTRARALFVDRGAGRDGNVDAEEHDEGGKGDGASMPSPAPSSGGDTSAQPASVMTAELAAVALPCGRCDRCIAGLLDKCWWCCRVAFPGTRPDARWCAYCNSAEASGRRVQSRAVCCTLHKAAKQRRVSGALPTPPLVVAATRRRSSSVQPPPSASPATSASQRPRRAVRRLSDLPLHAPERAIVEDASLALAYLTPDALRSTSERGVLLRRAIARSGRCWLFVVDEAHTCLHISQGAFREACAQLGVTLATLLRAVEALGADPFQLLALTATLPPGKLEREALLRLRLGDDCTVLRGPVDRERCGNGRLNSQP